MRLCLYQIRPPTPAAAAVSPIARATSTRRRWGVFVVGESGGGLWFWSTSFNLVASLDCRLGHDCRGRIRRVDYSVRNETEYQVKLMPQTISAKLDAGSKRFAIIIARFNEFITNRLLGGAIDALTRHGADEESLTAVWVPGAWEIPITAQKLAQSENYDAIICLGCVIRGQTPHFDYVAAEVSKGIAQVSLAREIPITFGVVTADSLEQAIDRAGAKAGNKGSDAALAAIEMANLFGEIP